MQRRERTSSNLCDLIFLSLIIISSDVAFRRIRAIPTYSSSLIYIRLLYLDSFIFLEKQTIPNRTRIVENGSCKDACISELHNTCTKTMLAAPQQVWRNLGWHSDTSPLVGGILAARQLQTPADSTDVAQALATHNSSPLTIIRLTVLLKKVAAISISISKLI